MSDFPTPVSRPNYGEFTRVLTEDWEWEYSLGGTHYRVYVPRGVEYEPSIPPPAEAVIPSDRIETASLPHDIFYKLKGDLSGPNYSVLSSRWQEQWHRRMSVTRRYADDVFRHVLQKTEVADWRVWLAYKAVRLGGQRAWEEADQFELPKTLYPDE